MTTMRELSVLSSDRTETLLEARWVGGRVSILAGVAGFTSAMQQRVLHGFDEWIETDDGPILRHTVESDEAFLPRVAALLQRQYDVVVTWLNLSDAVDATDAASDWMSAAFGFSMSAGSATVAIAGWRGEDTVVHASFFAQPQLRAA